MAAYIYIILYFFLISYTVCQECSSDGVTENPNSIKLRKGCVCSETSNPNDSGYVFNIFCTQLEIENGTDLNKIEWPQSPNGLNVSAIFDGLNILTLGKLPPNPLIKWLKLSNSAIEIYWPEPFRDLPNLIELSLASNRLTSVTFDLLQGVPLLEELDLSQNKISDINQLAFQNLKNLKRLNLQNNRLKSVPLEALLPLTGLEELDLSTNGILDLTLQHDGGVGLTRLKRLSLKSNRIRSLTKQSLPEDNSLEFLDLSENKIELVDEEALLSYKNLKELNLEQNNITLVFKLPASLVTCNLRMNSMRHWPSFPPGIELIDLSYNRLETIYDSTADFSHLEALYLMGNQISELNIEKPLPKLATLDLSYNFLKEIPKECSVEFLPNLYELWLDGNPIERLYFSNVIVLKKLHLKEIPRLKFVEEKAFTNVIGRSVADVNKCFDLHLSNCHSLSEIHQNAFEGTAVCMLDISSNNLTNLPRDLLPWASVADGVDLQRNPWRCACDLQWLLDQLLPLLYRSHAYLLDDVRCGSPRAVEQLRLVHWYNWTDRTLCSDYIGGGGPRLSQSIENLFADSNMTLILSIAIVLLSIVAMGLIIYLVCTRKRHVILQATARRRKQQARDIDKNGHSEQLKALNKA